MRLFLKYVGTPALAALLLGACGSGETPGDQSPALKIASVKVMGDSLSDSGTFEGIPSYGRIFSVQADDSLIWTERIAKMYVGTGAPLLCNVYSFTGSTFTPTA